jgi:hypothetical protein
VIAASLIHPIPWGLLAVYAWILINVVLCWIFRAGEEVTPS